MINKFSKAFTLIELLVVIVIISILAAMLMAALSSVLENSRTTQCTSNLRQIGNGMFLFAGEHGGNFPQSGGSIPWGSVDGAPPAGSGQASWMEQLSVYMGLSVNSSGTTSNDPQNASGKSIFTCPSSSIQSTLAFDKYYSYFNGAHSAYATTGGFAPVNQHAIAYPAETILSGDITHSSWSDASNGKLDADKDDYSQNPFDTLSTFHHGRVNILFADGHVSLLSWNANLSPPGYFDMTTMATHYAGTSQNDSTVTGYLNP